MGNVLLKEQRRTVDTRARFSERAVVESPAGVVVGIEIYCI